MKRSMRGMLIRITKLLFVEKVTTVIVTLTLCKNADYIAFSYIVCYYENVLGTLCFGLFAQC